MRKLAIPFSIAALALAACAGPNEVQTPIGANAAPIVPQPLAYAPGYGTVESVLFRDVPMSSVSGGTATGVPSNSAGRAVRLGIRMQDGTLQYVDTDSDQFPKGTKVLLTSDHILKKM